MPASPLSSPASRWSSLCARCPHRNIPPPTAAKAASPALEAVTACETVVGLVGTCFSMAVSLASNPAPAKANGTVHCHSTWVMWNGVVQKFF